MKSSPPHRKLELSSLVLGYCRHVGGIVEPPAYGIYEVLIPDTTADRLRLDPLNYFAFDDVSAQSSPEKVTFLHYGHPTVDDIITIIQGKTANARLHINNVRLAKRGLFGLAKKQLKPANARLFEIRQALERRVLHSYVRFNFKVSLITDEKRETLLPIWMHLQGGYWVNGEEIEARASFDTEAGFENLPESPLLWGPKGRREKAADPFVSQAVLTELLERARLAAPEMMSGQLDRLRRRGHRFLELDKARLEEYFDDLQSNLEKRLRSANAKRRPGIEAKLAAVETERRSKFADAESKYNLRIELELINLMVVTQPKISLEVEFRNRTTTVTRPVVWDPLLHRLEPPICDVCGKPGDELSLCIGEHMAHAGCLAPQCVHCRRVYCRLCSDQVKTCVVCERPVCVHSLIRCESCERVTCREHGDLCHAEDGKPGRVADTAQETTESPPKQAAVRAAAAPPPGPAKPARAGQRSSRKTAAAKAAGVKGRAGGKRTGGRRPVPKGPKAGRIEVYIELQNPAVIAYVIGSRQRQIATRTWELTESGIEVECRCEKGWRCREGNRVLYPKSAQEIEGQLRKEIGKLRREYQVQPKKVSVYRVVRDQPQSLHRLMLVGRWKDAGYLARARKGFDELGE